MTKHEFLEELKAAVEKHKAFRTYEYLGKKSVRITLPNTDHYFCPLTFLYWDKTQKYLHVNMTHIVARDLNISDKDRLMIVSASDTKSYPLLRKAIEATCPLGD